jgi:hypothetical protein
MTNTNLPIFIQQMLQPGFYPPYVRAKVNSFLLVTEIKS